MNYGLVQPSEYFYSVNLGTKLVSPRSITTAKDIALVLLQMMN